MTDLQGSRVEMTINDGWADIGWTGVVVSEDDEDCATVRWDNGMRLRHMKIGLRIMSVTEGDNPNAIFKMRKYKELNLL